jgi:RNA polymerase sigma-70 factor (ECF subfamily)
MDRTLQFDGHTAGHFRKEARDDDELVARARTRDPAALTVLYQRFHDSAVGFAYLRLRDRDDAEDAVQTAWAKALNALDQFRGTAKFSTWLFTIVVNECRGWQKRSKRSQTTSLEAVMDLGQWSSLKAAKEPVETDLEYERLQMQTRLRQQIRRLPMVYRRVLWLRYIVGLPLCQVACLLKISMPAAKSRIMRARAELRVTVQEAQIRGESATVARSHQACA